MHTCTMYDSVLEVNWGNIFLNCIWEEEKMLTWSPVEKFPRLFCLPKSHCDGDLNPEPSLRSISTSLNQNHLIVNHPLVLACKVQGHLLKDFPNFCQESHRESETYLKALLGQVLDPGVVDLAKPVWVTSCVVCIHAPLYLPHQSSALFGISQTYVKLLHTLCCNIIITIITSCWEPASHSVTGISPGQSYLVSSVWFWSPTPSWLYWFHS